MQLRPEGPENPWSALAAPRTGELWLLVAPFRILEMEYIIIPLLAVRGPVHILVGGRGYDVDGILHSLRKLTPDITLRQHIRQRRAPTAFQMRALLKKTPATPDPLIVLNFLVHYFDEDEQFWKNYYLLEGSLAELQRLSRVGPMVVTVRPPPPGTNIPSGPGEPARDDGPRDRVRLRADPRQMCMF